MAGLFVKRLVQTVCTPHVQLLQVFREIFLPERSEFRSFREELHYQSLRVSGPGAILLMFITLPYLGMDAKLHPQISILPLLRIVVSAAGLLSFLSLFLRPVRQHAMYLVYANLLIVQGSVAAITGLVGAHSSYTGGYAFVTVAICLLPLPRILAWSVLPFSGIIFASALAGTKPDFGSPAVQYGLQDLVTSFITTALFVYVLDRSRHTSFLKTLRIQEQKERTEDARREVQKLSEFARKVNESTDLETILSEILDYVQANFRIKGMLLQLVDPQTKELRYFKTNFQSFHDLDLRSYVESLRIPIGVKGSTATSIFRRGKPIYFPNMRIAWRHRDDDPLDQFVARADIHSALIVPLIAQQAPVGLLYFSNYQKPLPLTPHERDTIYAFCEQAAGAIQSRSLLEQVQMEREKSDRLLLNILPEKVARELKEEGSVKPRMYEHATVLFTDFKGFTRYAASMSPQELLRELDGVFAQFDSVAETYGMEKLKTIGDSYMCVGGLPEENGTHPVDACLTAIEMLAFMRQATELRELATGQKFWEIRIGIHTGSVVAGVIGKSKFAYDIWGDAVNIASRMESNGEPGRVNISEATAETVKDFFLLHHRGQVDVKNRGAMDMYFIEGLRPELRDLNGQPNERFRALHRAMLIPKPGNAT